jgi:hypothetical protein
MAVGHADAPPVDAKNAAVDRRGGSQRHGQWLPPRNRRRAIRHAIVLPSSRLNRQSPRLRRRAATDTDDPDKRESFLGPREVK